jgi:uncharacterized protein (TIGR03382 family)
VADAQFNAFPPNIDFNVDNSGQMHLYAAGTDYASGVSVTRGVWNHYQMDINFIDGTATAWYNGQAVVKNKPFTISGTTLGIYAFYAQASSNSPTDSAYFDNVAVSATTPEPGSFFLVLGAAGVLVGLVRRRRAQ